jgi:2-haloacid dehalogenase
VRPVIRGLLLDFYGTVVEDDDAIVADIVGQVSARSGVPAADVGAAWERAYVAETTGPQFRTLRECLLRSLASVLASIGCPGEPEVLCAPQLAYWAAPPLRPGTREFLAAVDLPICLVSDTDRAALDAAVALHGLDFAAVVTSEEVGAYKPARAMFDAGLARLGLASHEVVHVGDSLSNDIRGAQAAGIRAVWINRRGRRAPARLPVAYEVADLGGLLDGPGPGAILLG